MQRSESVGTSVRTAVAPVLLSGFTQMAQVTQSGFTITGTSLMSGRSDHSGSARVVKSVINPLVSVGYPE